MIMGNNIYIDYRLTNKIFSKRIFAFKQKIACKFFDITDYKIVGAKTELHLS